MRGQDGERDGAVGRAGAALRLGVEDVAYRLGLVLHERGDRLGGATRRGRRAQTNDDLAAAALLLFCGEAGEERVRGRESEAGVAERDVDGVRLAGADAGRRAGIAASTAQRLLTRGAARAEGDDRVDDGETGRSRWGLCRRSRSLSDRRSRCRCRS